MVAAELTGSLNPLTVTGFMNETIGREESSVGQNINKKALRLLLTFISPNLF